jgi:riboflavin kinase / FMN adenylyltransferase
MQVIRELADFPRLSCPIVTSGTFDGVHCGHQKILTRLLETAKQLKGQSVVLTYWPHPRLVLQPDAHDLKLLSTIEERTELLADFGVDYLLILPFTKAFSNLSSQEFIQQVLVEGIGTRKLVIGYDHRFGKNREGSFEHLSKNSGTYGFEVEEIPRHDVEEVAVSSTKIRNALLKGDIAVANQYLNRPYSFIGNVTRGKQLGRTIGFPTANLSVDSPLKLIPANGVYAVKVQHKLQQFNGMLNIGFQPTVNGQNLTIEVHLFDFSGDLYDQDLKVELITRLRDEQKFPSLEALQQQLKQDEKNARSLLTS